MLIFKVLSGFAAIGLGAALVLALPGFSPEVAAGTGISHPASKGDRLDYRVVGTGCSQKAWPYFEPQCLRDRKNVAGQARDVRLISTDRIAD
jgi:hypothetical protein